MGTVQNLLDRLQTLPHSFGRLVFKSRIELVDLLRQRLNALQ